MASSADAETPWPERYERNVRIVEAFAADKSCVEIAREFDTTYQSVRRVLRQAGIRPGPRGRGAAQGSLERYQEIKKAREAGETFVQISARLDVSRQRIHQIAQGRTCKVCKARSTRPSAQPLTEG